MRGINPQWLPQAETQIKGRAAPLLRTKTGEPQYYTSKRMIKEGVAPKYQQERGSKERAAPYTSKRKHPRRGTHPIAAREGRSKEVAPFTQLNMKEPQQISDQENDLKEEE
jgi:hypothetical protein